MENKACVTIWFYPSKQQADDGCSGVSAKTYLQAIALLKKLGFNKAIVANGWNKELYEKYRPKPNYKKIVKKMIKMNRVASRFEKCL